MRGPGASESDVSNDCRRWLARRAGGEGVGVELCTIGGLIGSAVDPTVPSGPHAELHWSSLACVKTMHDSEDAGGQRGSGATQCWGGQEISPRSGGGDWGSCAWAKARGEARKRGHSRSLLSLQRRSRLCLSVDVSQVECSLLAPTVPSAPLFHCRRTAQQAESTDTQRRETAAPTLPIVLRPLLLPPCPLRCWTPWMPAATAAQPS